MSGLFAVIQHDGVSIAPETIAPSIAHIAYRGRAGGGTWTHPDGHVVLHAALQPVTRTDRGDVQPATLDGVTLITDSLLLDRPGLVAALHTAGRPAAVTMTDSLLLLHAWHAWGERCVAHLYGEYAFILWDDRSGTVFAAHDPMRARELLYAALPGALIISNEMMAVLKHPAVSGVLDEAAVGDFLLFGFVERHGKQATLFRDVRRLLPAHWLRVGRDGALQTARYWDFPNDIPMRRNPRPADYVPEFRHLFRTVLRERLEDVERASVLMSGGMDSTSVAGMASSLIQAGEIPTRLSAVCTIYERIPTDREAFFARQVAEMHGFDLTVMVCDEYAMTQSPPTRTDPIVDLSGEMILDVERALAARGDLGLSGNGGDEIFTNTPFYQVLLQHSLPEAAVLFAWLWRHTGQRPHFNSLGLYLRGLMAQIRPPRPQPPSDYHYPAWLNPDFEQRGKLRERFLTPWSYSLKGLHKTQPEVPLYTGLGIWSQRTEFTFPKDYTPIELSVPFVDIRMVTYAMTLPPLPWNKRKRLLRESMAGLLPPDVLNRPKTPAPSIGKIQLSRPGLEWVDRWEAVPEFGQYVRKEALPTFFGSTDDRVMGLDIRALFFNEWLRGIRAELGK